MTYHLALLCIDVSGVGVEPERLQGHPPRLSDRVEVKHAYQALIVGKGVPLLQILDKVREVQGRTTSKVVAGSCSCERLEQRIGLAVQADRHLMRLPLLLRRGESHEQWRRLWDLTGHLQASLLCHAAWQT